MEVSPSPSQPKPAQASTQRKNMSTKTDFRFLEGRAWGRARKLGALINQINARLSAEKFLVNVSA